MLRGRWAVVGLVVAGWLAAAGAADPTAATVTDGEGKELKVAALKFGAGAHRLAFLADPAGASDDAKKGPLALELREPLSTTYKVGVVTYVPLASVESVRYDYDKKAARVAVKGVPEPLVGTLEYQGLNVLSFGGTADGKAATFVGGSPKKGSVRAVGFADARPVPARKGGSAWLVQIDQPKAMDPTLKASNVKFLYQFPGGAELLTDTAAVRKGPALKLDDAVSGLVPVAVDLNAHTAAVEFQMADGSEKVLVLSPLEKDGKKGVLVGLLGEVEAGWKLFPLHTVKSLKRAK
jgi:hypothetical protein